MADSQAYFATLERWQELKAAISKLQGEERALREGLFEGAFKTPVEGTNTMELPDGRRLKGVYNIRRTVREAEFDDLKITPALRKVIFKTKHTLQISAYRGLDSETRNTVDTILTIKPGLPTLSIVEATPDKAEVTP